MADNKPTPGDRKPYYIAPLVIAAVVVAILLTIFLRAPQPAPPPPPKKEVSVKPPQPPKPAVTMAPPAPLTRAELLNVARGAASEFAGTGKSAEGADPLVGRRFAIRISFACNGVLSPATASQLSVSYDAANQSITLTAQPGSWTDLPLVQSLPQVSEIEAVEGFWIPRPWTDSDACPPQMDYPAPATPTPATAQTLGIARIFSANDSRVQQHASRPYTFTRKVPATDAELLSHSYRLVLEGTLTSFPGGRALHCWMEGADHQPLCVYAASVTRIAFEDGTSGDVLASWTD